MARKVKWIVSRSNLFQSCPFLLGIILSYLLWQRCNFEEEDAKPHRSFVNHEEVTLLTKFKDHMFNILESHLFMGDSFKLLE